MNLKSELCYVSRALNDINITTLQFLSKSFSFILYVVNSVSSGNDLFWNLCFLSFYLELCNAAPLINIWEQLYDHWWKYPVSQRINRVPIIMNLILWTTFSSISLLTVCLKVLILLLYTTAVLSLNCLLRHFLIL